MKVGITGHQKLNNLTWVKDQILNVLQSQNLPLIGLTSLAIGADQLFAQIVFDCAGCIEVIVPMDDYAQSFDPEGLIEYERLISKAIAVEVLPSLASKEMAYFAAGKRIVDLSDILIAVWDGKPAAGLGGTGDIVDYVKSLGKKYIHINPDSKQTSFYNSN